jgi:hypothetical protein
MAHWAELNDDNVVLRVLVGNNDDPAGDEGYQWLIDNLGGTWVKTSYNGNIRKNFAGIGFVYDSELDAFVPPKPFESWELDKATCQWVAPVEYPTDGIIYTWNEASLDWEAVIYDNPSAE